MWINSEIENINIAKKVCKEKIDAIKALYPNLIWNDMFIAGGFIASLLQNVQYNDIDIYSKTEDAVKRVEKVVLDRSAIPVIQRNWKEVAATPYRYYIDKGHTVSEYAITTPKKYSFIIKNSGEPEQITKSFDLLHCCSYYDIQADKLFLSKEVHDAIVNKHLIINNLSACSLSRIQKFLDRGYEMKFDLNKIMLPF